MTPKSSQEASNRPADHGDQPLDRSCRQGARPPRYIFAEPVGGGDIDMGLQSLAGTAALHRDDDVAGLRHVVSCIVLPQVVPERQT